MYLELLDNNKITVQFDVGEFHNWYIEKPYQATFDAVAFLEDILAINLNEFRNYLIRNITLGSDVNDMATYYGSGLFTQDVERILQEKSIFPQRWKTKVVPRLISKGWHLYEVSAFYNAVLMLKQNRFNAACINKIAEDLPKVYSSSKEISGHIFQTTLEMMVYDLFQEGTDIASYDQMRSVMRRFSTKSGLIEMLDAAMKSSYSDFCSQFFLPTLLPHKKLSAIYACLSVPSINLFLRTEVNSAKEHYCEDDLIQFGYIRPICSHMFLEDGVSNRFLIEKYVRELYKTYEVENTYAMNVSDFFDWLCLIVSCVLKNGYSIRKCDTCNSFLVRKYYGVGAATEECQECFAQNDDEKRMLKDVKDLLKKNLHDFHKKKRRPDLYKEAKSLYVPLHGIVWDLLEEYCADMLREKSFVRLAPENVDFEGLNVSDDLMQDFLAQNSAEYALLDCPSGSMEKFNALKSIWFKYRIPTKFLAFVLQPTSEQCEPRRYVFNQENLRRLEEDFKPYVKLKSVASFSAIYQKSISNDLLE